MNQDVFLSDLAKDFEANRSKEILIHGLRTQAMFAYVAAALGKCVVIKEEGAGELYTSNPAMRAPDFRIVTVNGQEFLVEVKNHRPRRASSPYSASRTYLDSLQAYAAAFKRPLYLAIYWSQLKGWALVPAESLQAEGHRYVLPMAAALKRNEMALLGDLMIGTIPSLTLKLYSDSAKSRRIGSDGLAQFTVQRAELFCGADLILDSKEREIAWFLMNYGNWPSTPIPADVAKGELIAMGVTAAPTERANPDEHFEIIGLLSEMVSRQYNDMTASSGRVDLLPPKRDPDKLGVLIPSGFLGNKLRLWVFVLQPFEEGG